MKLGPLIGCGATRSVYEHPTNPAWIVKVQHGNTANEYDEPEWNRREWMLWRLVRGTQWEDLFAPCVDLTKQGHLVMLRCDPCVESRKESVRILDVTIINTKHPANNGWLDGRMVLVDYGHRSAQRLILKLEKQRRLRNPRAR